MLPEELQLSTLFTAAVMSSARDRRAARALVSYLGLPEVGENMRAKGLLPAR